MWFCAQASRYGRSLLAKRYQLPVYAVARQRLRSAAAAEEVTQVVFVTAYQKLEQSTDRDKFGAWLRKIAVRQCSMHLRSETQKERIMHKLEVGDPSIDPATPIIYPLIDQPNFFEIESLIDKLPEGLRATAVLWWPLIYSMFWFSSFSLIGV